MYNQGMYLQIQLRKQIKIQTLFGPFKSQLCSTNLFVLDFGAYLLMLNITLLLFSYLLKISWSPWKCAQKLTAIRAGLVCKIDISAQANATFWSGFWTCSCFPSCDLTLLYSDWCWWWLWWLVLFCIVVWEKIQYMVMTGCKLQLHQSLYILKVHQKYLKFIGCNPCQSSSGSSSV